MNIKNIVACTAILTSGFAFCEIREVSFPKDEIPGENPRIEMSGDVATHIEVFGVFDKRSDGSVVVPVIESSGDVAHGDINSFVSNAQERLSVLPTWEGKYNDILPDAELSKKTRKDAEKAEKKDQKNFEKWLKDTTKAMEKSSADMQDFYADIIFFATNRNVNVEAK